ncbi:hypothetical protein AAE478_005092 [Parahypoxylon ruwenzoriense]
MATVIPIDISEKSILADDNEFGPQEERISDAIPPLGKSQTNKRLWFQRTKKENLHRFDSRARWTWAEESKVVRKIDWRIMAWTAIMFTAMELDRANLAQSLTDNFLDDMHMTTDAGEFPAQLLAKWLGPDRWIPSQIVLFSVVSASQFALSNRSSFLICRALLAFLQGGFIPECVLYLSYFYKHHELTIRLGFFWTGMFLADIVAAVVAFGLLHMRGVEGRSGWSWLFLIEARLRQQVGLGVRMAGLQHGKRANPPFLLEGIEWNLTAGSEETIMVNRIIRDDPSKGTMHNRQPITPKLLWKSLTDVDLWPLYGIGLTFNIPTFSPQQYLSLSLRGLGFDTFQTNLLSIPYLVLKSKNAHRVFRTPADNIIVINMMALATLAEYTGQLAACASIFQFWCLPFLIYLRVVDTTKVSKWLTWGMISLLLAAPLGHPVQVGWISRNSNTVRSRAVGAALYNMFLQTGVIISSNIYRSDDAPLYRRGNSILIGILSLNLVLYVLAKAYYVRRNRIRERKWDAMTPEEKLVYLADHQDAGNKRLDFRLAS